MGKSDSAVPMMMGESSSSAAATQARIISMIDGVEKAHAVAARLRVGKYLLHIVKRHIPTDLSFAVLLDPTLL